MIAQPEERCDRRELKLAVRRQRQRGERDRDVEPVVLRGLDDDAQRGHQRQRERRVERKIDIARGELDLDLGNSQKGVGHDQASGTPSGV